MVCAGSAGQLLVRAAAVIAPARFVRQLWACGRALDVTPRAHALRRRAHRGKARMMASTTDDGQQQQQQQMGIADRPPAPMLSGLGAGNGKDQANGYPGGQWKSEDGKLRCGSSSFRGRRGTMEDYYDVKITKVDGQAVSLFGVFDGHGGSLAAEYLKENLFSNILRHPLFITDTKLALSEAFQKTDREFLDSDAFSLRDDGSTASAAILVGNRLYVANVGDSRAVISKAGEAIPLSEDHKPNRTDERQRIEDAGGVVVWAGTWRVGGVLAMSRAFGNRLLKPAVVADPEIQETIVDQDLECLILATDGLWDVVSNEDAVEIAMAAEEPEDAAQKLTDAAFSRFSADNITCIVVRFHYPDQTKTDGR